MPQVRLPDAAGNTMLLMEYGQKPYYGIPFIPDRQVEDVHNVEIRDDDVMLISYPKSGCHWLNEIASMLLAGTPEAEVTAKESKMLEFATQEELRQLPSPRLLNTHLYFHQLPKKVQDGKVKLLFIYRNPKDVAVSFYNHHLKITEYEYKGQKFSDYLTGLFLKGHVDFGDIFTYTRDWESVMDKTPELPVFFLSYEELQADTMRKTKELASFLGCSVDDATIQKIVDKCSFKQMLPRRGKEWEERYGNPVMYRKGKVGDWKTWFTVAQSEMMDAICQEKMKGSRIQFQYTL